jgi:glycosyltransferase involved in cell wall biosynthesis
VSQDSLKLTSVSKSDTYSFLFPSAPDSHKNFECVCQAAKIVREKSGINDFSVTITVKGDENAYAKWLYRKWGTGIPNILFTGYLDKKTLYSYYQQSHCLIFPSKIETWGLPVTEFASFRKPMLLADMPYAHESASGCSKVAFFDPDNPHELAVQMQRLIQGDESFLTTLEKNNIPEPVARSWQELFILLLA